jgi:hypothetical protein
LEAVIKSQENKAVTHAEIFRKTTNINYRMMQISIGEIVVIIATGCYQFWTIWNFLKSRRNV